MKWFKKKVKEEVQTENPHEPYSGKWIKCLTDKQIIAEVNQKRIELGDYMQECEKRKQLLYKLWDEAQKRGLETDLYR